MICFRCDCGRTLKAPERLAGKLTRCPKCGTPCSVPAILPDGTESGVGAESSNSTSTGYSLTQNERVRNGHQPSHRYIAEQACATPDTPDAYSLEPIPTEPKLWSGPPKPDPEHKRTAFFEPHPTDEWLGPSEKRKYFWRLAGLQTVVCALGFGTYPYVVNSASLWMNGVTLLLVLIASLFLLMGYGCLILNGILLPAICGKDADIDWSPDVYSVIGCFARWMTSFLCGPVILIAFAFYYAIHCGGPTLLDAIILIELAAFAMTYWLTSLLLLARDRDARQPSPRQVFLEIQRLGLLAVKAGTIAGLGLAAFVGLTVCAMITLQEAWLFGVGMLSLLWFATWASAAWGMQKLGCLYRQTLRRKRATSTAEAIA